MLLSQTQVLRPFPAAFSERGTRCGAAGILQVWGHGMSSIALEPTWDAGVGGDGLTWCTTVPTLNTVFLQPFPTTHYLLPFPPENTSAGCGCLSSEGTQAFFPELKLLVILFWLVCYFTLTLILEHGNTKRGPEEWPIFKPYSSYLSWAINSLGSSWCWGSATIVTTVASLFVCCFRCRRNPRWPGGRLYV